MKNENPTKLSNQSTAAAFSSCGGFNDRQQFVCGVYPSLLKIRCYPVLLWDREYCSTPNVRVERYFCGRICACHKVVAVKEAFIRTLKQVRLREHKLSSGRFWRRHTYGGGREVVNDDRCCLRTKPIYELFTAEGKESDFVVLKVLNSKKCELMNVKSPVKTRRRRPPERRR